MPTPRSTDFYVFTSNLWLGHQVLLARQGIEEVSWAESTVSVDLSRQLVKEAPPFDPALPLDPELELRTLSALWTSAMGRTMT